jgi:hypothetical protein
MGVELNKNYNLREQILFGEDYDAAHYRMGGIRYFEISPVKLANLVQLGFADPHDAQNSAPSIEEFIEFFNEQFSKEWYVHGYAVSPERDDYRVSVEGCGKHGEPTQEEICDFVLLFRHADELQVGDCLYCWYD